MSTADNQGIIQESEVVPLEFLVKKKTVATDANFISEARDIVQQDILAIEKDFNR
jgi:hypothetical protein